MYKGAALNGTVGGDGGSGSGDGGGNADGGGDGAINAYDGVVYTVPASPSVTSAVGGAVYIVPPAGNGGGADAELYTPGADAELYAPGADAALYSVPASPSCSSGADGAVYIVPSNPTAAICSVPASPSINTSTSGGSGVEGAIYLVPEDCVAIGQQPQQQQEEEEEDVASGDDAALYTPGYNSGGADPGPGADGTRTNALYDAYAGYTVAENDTTIYSVPYSPTTLQQPYTTVPLTMPAGLYSNAGTSAATSEYNRLDRIQLPAVAQPADAETYTPVAAASPPRPQPRPRPTPRSSPLSPLSGRSAGGLTQAETPEEKDTMEQKKKKKKKKKPPPGPLMEMLPGGVSSLRGTHHGTTIEYPSTPLTSNI